LPWARDPALKVVLAQTAINVVSEAVAVPVILREKQVLKPDVVVVSCIAAFEEFLPRPKLTAYRIPR
jgi:hypothetical protein